MYTFGIIFSSKKATIRLQPAYTVGILEGADIYRWESTTATSFEQAPSEFTHSNRANVRLKVIISRDVSTIEHRAVWTMFDFLAGVVCYRVFCCCCCFIIIIFVKGSSVALFSVGLKLLGFWQSMSMPKKKGKKKSHNPYARRVTMHELHTVSTSPPSRRTSDAVSPDSLHQSS